jgi:hypothetical protein
VLRKNLIVQTALAQTLAMHDYDPLELLVGLDVRDTNTGCVTTLAPPIVEESELDGVYVLDGAHRTILGRYQGRAGFLAVVISGILEDCPSYAIPNDWDGADGIRVVESIPGRPEHKKHYRAAYEGLYRNLSDLGSSGLRRGDSNA